MGGFSVEGRISDPLPEPPTASLVSHPQGFSILPGGRTKVHSTPGRSGRVDGEEGHRGSRSYDPRFLQSAVPGSQEGRDMEASPGRLQTEQICSEDQIFLYYYNVCLQ